ncbi:hypothetical protein F5X96DRAFT_626120, partial [Biscogniauxia mediterranea]
METLSPYSPMSLPNSSPDDQVFSSKAPKCSKSPARLRSACDPCHQAKIKCSGESPCLACKASRARCILQSANHTRRQRQQQSQYQYHNPPGSNSVGLDFDHDFNTVVENFIADINQNSLLGPNLGSLISSTSESSLHM